MFTYISNRTVIVLALVAILCSSTAIAFAQTSTIPVASSTPEETPSETASSTETEVPETRQEERADRIESRQNLREARQVALTEVRQQRILNLSANISNRMDGAINRLYSIIERLESRIQKLSEAGVNTEAASAKVREAAGYLAEARTLMSTIDTVVYGAATSPTPYSAWQEVRVTYATVGGLIRNTHQALRESIALLKTPEPQTEESENEAATSTSEVTE